MGRNKLIEKAMLLPMSKLYGMGVAVRNRMFEWHLLKQHKFDIPVVVVGNLSVGGTGKTPHTEYVINALRGVYRIGVLSRGYKRPVGYRRRTLPDVSEIWPSRARCRV